MVNIKTFITIYKLYIFIFRGKGDYFRLGHGSSEHVRKPKPVSGLQGKKIVQFSTGLSKLYFIKGS